MKFSVSYFFRYPKNYFSSVTARVNEYLGRNLAISGATLHLQVRILIFAVREWLHHDRGRWHLRHLLVYLLAPEGIGTKRLEAKKLRGW